MRLRYNHVEYTFSVSDVQQESSGLLCFLKRPNDSVLHIVCMYTSSRSHGLRTSLTVALNFGDVKTVCSALDPFLAREAMFTSNRSSKFLGSKKWIVVDARVRVVCLPHALSSWIYSA
jgi:3,4-dihydroxy-2-butanone 4-phosphate synthase